MFNILRQFTVLFLVLVLIGCSAQELFVKAINYERSRANFSAKSVQLELGKISYLDNGIEADTAIILLHGFGGDKDNWNRFSAELDERSRIIVPDLPGHGKSVSNLNLGYSISHQAEMLAAFLEKLGVSNIHIIGNSMGGAIALRYAVTHSQSIKSLTLIDSLGITKIKSEFDTVVQKTGSNPMFDICTEEKLESLLRYGMHKPPYIPGIFMDYLVSQKCSRSEIEKIIYNEMREDSDLTEILNFVTAQTLIIWGKRDRVIHVDNSYLLNSAIKGSDLIIIDDAGHVPLLETPEITGQLVDAFIKNL